MMNIVGSVFFSAGVALGIVALPASAVFAQMAPGDTGAGFQRGISELHASGQIGTVTLYHAHDGGTRVQVELTGVPAGRTEPLAIVRGKSCRKLQQLGWVLQPLKEDDASMALSTTYIDVPMARLTSGNYVVVAHADDAVSGHNVACGELF